MNKLLLLVGIIVIAGLIMLVQDIDDVQSKSISVSSSSGGLEPLAVVSCSPDSGYDHCDAEREIFAYAEVQYTDYKGKLGYGYVDGANRWYYVKEVYMDVKFEGDHLYASNSPSWPMCNENGCSWPEISPGKYVLVTAPSKTIPEIGFVAFDKDYSSTGTLYWVWVGNGFYEYDAYVIGCYDASDCGSNEYCDKSGAWDTWSCAVDPCSTMPAPENICDEFDVWAQKCVMGEYVKDFIIETNSKECGCIVQEPVNTCIGFDLWTQKQAVSCVEGLVSDKIIQSNSPDCGCIVQETPDICINFDMWSQKQSTMCVEGLEKDKLINEKSNKCGYVCDEDEAKGFTCTDGTNVITQLCINNEWTDIEAKSCPLNWINLEMILNEYLEDMKEWMRTLL